MECDCVFVGEGQGKEGEEGEEDRGCGSSRRSSGRRGGASGGKVGRTEEENRKRLRAFQPGSNHRIQRGKRLLCHSNSSKTYSDLHAILATQRLLMDVPIDPAFPTNFSTIWCHNYSLMNMHF